MQVELGLGRFCQSLTKPGVSRSNDPLWKKGSAALFTAILHGVSDGFLTSDPRPTQCTIQLLYIERVQSADSEFCFLNMGSFIAMQKKNGIAAHLPPDNTPKKDFLKDIAKELS